MTRRQVVVLPEFFDHLDQLLPAERSPDGRPSATDFALHDLTAIIDTLATKYDATTLAVPETDVRVLVTAGMTVSFVAIYVQERDDGTIEIITLDLAER